MDLNVERQNVAAKVGGHAVHDQQIPKLPDILGADFTLVGATEAIDGKHRMMTQNQLVAGIGVIRQGPRQPFGFKVPLAAERHRRGMNENHQQVATPDKIGEALLLRRAVAWKLGQHLGEDPLAHSVIGGVVGSGVENRRPLPVNPSGLHFKPVPPLSPQRGFIGGKADDLVAEKRDELGHGVQSTRDGVHRRESRLVPPPGTPEQLSP